MPADDRLGLDDDQDGLPTRPQPGERDPEGAIEGREPRPPLLLDVDRELLPERELDERLVLPAPDKGWEAAKGGDEEATRLRIEVASWPKSACARSLNLVRQEAYPLGTSPEDADQITSDEY